jgi:hypothetical protein
MSTATGKGPPPPRWLLKAFTRTHVMLHRLNGGSLFNKLAGDEVCFVTMTGAKSGRRLTIPLMYGTTGEFRAGETPWRSTMKTAPA